jgi:hypothetical protein
MANGLLVTEKATAASASKFRRWEMRDPRVEPRAGDVLRTASGDPPLKVEVIKRSGDRVSYVMAFRLRSTTTIKAWRENFADATIIYAEGE